MRFMTDPRQHGGHGPHGPHGGRKRARRGLVRGAILHLLAERPMHGYELINELEQRTGGRWKPSPGSVYPTLSALEDEGLITAVETDGKKRYELTEAGQTWLRERAERPGFEGPDGPPWAGRRFGGFGDFGSMGELRRLGGELFGQLRQVGRFGSAEQQAQAKAILARTRDELYAVMAQPRPDEATEGEADDGEATDADPTTDV
jgi:DNA-binding PadR family transcriptional regulator